MAFRKNKPGCPCCDCTCPDEGPSYPKFSTMRIVISGLAASYDYYNESQWDFGQVQTHDGTVTGLDAVNGTYIISSELGETLNAGCIDDSNTSYPILVYEEEFILYHTDSRTRYFNFDCDPDPGQPFPPVTATVEYENEIHLRVWKEADHRYRVTLTGQGTPQVTGGEMLLSGCQNFACENNFDATTDGTLGPSVRDHSIDGAGPWPCSDGDIWFVPFSFSDESSSTICGIGRVFAEPDLVGTITATLE
jgi:hypothetical protein